MTPDRRTARLVGAIGFALAAALPCVLFGRGRGVGPLMVPTAGRDH